MECIWLSANKVDDPRAYYTQWSKSEEKNKCHIIYSTHIWNLERWHREAMETQRTDLWMQRGKERVGQIERAAWKHRCYQMQNQITSGNSLYDTGSRNPELCDDTQGGVVGGGRGLKRKGTRVCLPLIHADVWQRATWHCKAVILRVKVNTFEFKKREIWLPRAMRQGCSIAFTVSSELRLFPVGQSRSTGRKTCLHSQFIWLWKWVMSYFFHFSLIPPFRVSSHSLQSYQRGPHENRGQDFPGGPEVKNSPSNAGDTGSIPGLGRFHMLWDD